MQKRVMIIGAAGSGKTTLMHALLGDGERALKTQALDYRGWVIDTPGEYSENPHYYKSLMATSLEAGALLIVQDATRDRGFLPPGFAAAFPVPAVGAVTKCDLPDADPERAKRLLRESLPEGEIFVTSARTGRGIKKLAAALAKLTR